MPPKCLILIPPSEGKTPDGEGPPLTKTTKPVKEIGGPKGPEPTRYGDWERKGIISDF